MVFKSQLQEKRLHNKADLTLGGSYSRITCTLLCQDVVSLEVESCSYMEFMTPTVMFPQLAPKSYKYDVVLQKNVRHFSGYES